MTTIAYRAGIIAADMGVYGATGFGGHMRKVAINEATGMLAGFAGEIGIGTAFLEYFEQSDNPLEEEWYLPPDTSIGMICTPAEKIYLVQDSFLVPLHDDYYAIGTGAGFALAAMRMGADALTAVKIAALHDPYTKYPIETLSQRRDNVVKFKRKRKAKPKPEGGA